MKVLLTGATGFIGSHIGAHLLDARHQVIGLKRSSSEMWRCKAYTGKVEWLDNDFAGWQQKVIASNPEVIIHCAWSGVAAAERNDWTHQEKNIQFFCELLKIAAVTDCKRFIGLGSQAEYGIVNGRVSEIFPTLPNTAYGAAKIACLNFLEAFARQKSLSYAWLRLFSVYGPGESEQWFIPNLIKQFRDGNSPKLTGCEQRYDYLYVNDLCRAVLAALDKNHNGIFNLGSNESVTLKSIVQKVHSLSGSQIHAEFGALPYRTGQSMHIEGDSTKFYSTFAFAPKISLEQGLQGYFQTRIC